MVEVRIKGEQAHDALKDREAKMNPKFIDNAWLMGRLAHLHSEISEAYEYVMHDDPECFAKEMADVIIYATDICFHLNIDLTKNVQTRLKELKEMPQKFEHNPY